MLTLDDICQVLHLDCYGPWHAEGHHYYRETESHHRNQHMIMAKKIYLAINHGLDKVNDAYVFNED